MTRAEIQEALWGEDQFVEFDHAINTAVKKIRTALDDDAEDPRFIETLPRKGYRFIGSVEYVSPNALADTGPSTDASAGGETKDPPGAVGDIDPLLAPMESTGAETALLSAGVARALFVAIQIGYLALYCSTLYYIDRLGGIFSALEVPVPNQILVLLIIIAAMWGIAVRLYLLSSVGLAHPAAGRQFQRLFPALLVLDSLWAASPLLAGLRIGFGLALAAAAGLAYLPFFPANSDPEHLLHYSLTSSQLPVSSFPARLTTRPSLSRTTKIYAFSRRFRLCYAVETWMSFA